MGSQHARPLKEQFLVVFSGPTRRCLLERKTRISRTFLARPQLHQPVRNLLPVRLQDRTLIQTMSIPSHSQSRKRQFFADSNVTTSFVRFVTERPDTATA